MIKLIKPGLTVLILSLLILYQTSNDKMVYVEEKSPIVAAQGLG